MENARRTKRYSLRRLRQANTTQIVDKFRRNSIVDRQPYLSRVSRQRFAFQQRRFIFRVGEVKERRRRSRNPTFPVETFTLRADNSARAQMCKCTTDRHYPF
jgi:hypothetical protein